MQRRALEAFAAQCILAQKVGSLPPSLDFSLTMAELTDKLTTAPRTEQNLHDLLSQRGVELPRDYSTRSDLVVRRKPSSSSTPVIVYLLDMEGTMTPLPFIQEILVPLACRHVEEFMLKNFPKDKDIVGVVKAASYSSPDLKTAFKHGQEVHFSNEELNKEIRQLFCDTAKKEMLGGSKLPFVKALQAAIWAGTFASGESHLEVFSDVYDFLHFAGTAESPNTHVAIYSSATVRSQKTALSKTRYGDLNAFITAYFDPSIVGSKLMPNSYNKIQCFLCEQLNLNPNDLQILFVTDNTTEASAADASGAVDCSIFCVRPLNTWVTYDTLLAVSVPHISTLTQLIREDETVDYDHLAEEASSCMRNSPLAVKK